MSTEDRHRWRFFRSGGVDQVLLRDGNDIAHLRELDFKLWMALSMPVQGTSLDRNTLAMIDADSDGRIRPRELLEAIEWARQKLASLDILLEHGDALPLEQIQDENLRRAARTILSGREKMNAGTIGMDDIIGCPELFDGLDFNGDGILLPGAIEDPPLRAAAEDILSVMEGAEDACGSRGLTDETLKAFFSQTQGYLEWLDKEPGAVPPSLDKESATKAWEALLPVRGKIDDYFVRVLTAAYDPEAAAALNPDRQRYAELAPENLSRSSQALSALPLAIAAPGKPLPLDGAVNPA